MGQIDVPEATDEYEARKRAKEILVEKVVEAAKGGPERLKLYLGLNFNAMAEPTWNRCYGSD